MPNFTSYRTALTFAVVCSIALLTGSASAHPSTNDTGVAIGTGTIAPGLPPAGCIPNQTVTFTGSTVVAGDHTGAYSVSFIGGSGAFCESLVVGQGNGTLLGSGPGVLHSDVNALHYDRNGLIVTLSINPGKRIYYGGFAHPAGSFLFAVCEFVPTSFNWTTTYTLACEWHTP